MREEKAYIHKNKKLAETQEQSSTGNRSKSDTTTPGIPGSPKQTKTTYTT